MHLMRADLGVDCEYCHVSTLVGMGAEKDDLEPKRTARKMLQMVMDVNKTQFGGAQQVTCYTCHRGSPVPLTSPVLPVTFEPEKPEPSLPSVDDLLSKYIQALGGEQAIRSVTSRVLTGTEEIPTGPGGGIMVPAQAEQYRKAPNLVLNVFRTPKDTTSNGFDGATAWNQNATGQVTQPLRLDQMRIQRDADFYDPLDLKKKYARMTVTGIEKVNGRDVYVVVGAPAGDSPERLYFDTENGLLARKATFVQTAIGRSPMEIDYSDYRDAGHGVKIPYVVRYDPPTPRNVLSVEATFRVEKVQENVTIETSRFAKPVARPAATPARLPGLAPPRAAASLGDVSPQPPSAYSNRTQEGTAE
jgi:hypothetical protein